MPKIETLADADLAEASSVTIGTGDLVRVHMPDGMHYEVAEILTIDARIEGPEGPGRVMHMLTLGESYYHNDKNGGIGN
jgi:hypothetical protein